MALQELKFEEDLEELDFPHLPDLDFGEPAAPELELSPPTFEEPQVEFATAPAATTEVAPSPKRTEIGEDLPPQAAAAPAKPELDIRTTLGKEPEPEVPLGETLQKEGRVKTHSPGRKEAE